MVLIEAEQRSLADERVARRTQPHADAYAEELADLIRAAFTVVAETGTLDPPVREILRTAGLSNQAFYRHVDSKDELLLLMLDEGRRSLVSYLERRMAPCTTPQDRLDVWTRGVLAQASDADAARRTRPFLAQADRLAELFPDEQRRSEDLLIRQVADAGDTDDAGATAIYDLAFGALGRALRRGNALTGEQLDRLVQLVLAVAGETTIERKVS
ncbi:MAG: TetR family transcriptional regulator [Acidimicrobiales bacterium]|nr:TetR family transcriptional regulator [Acidimicrobiales bacterium]